MIRTIAIVVFGSALACAAQAMPLAPPLHEPDPCSRKPLWAVDRVWLWSTAPAWPGVLCAKLGAARDGTEAFALSGNNCASAPLLM